MESLLPFLLFLVYALFRMLEKGRARPGPAPQPSPGEQPPHEAIDRIREMFGLEPLEAPPVPPPLPPPTEFRSVTPRPRPVPLPPAVPVASPQAAASVSPDPVHPVARLLRRPETAREAVIINEVLGKPKALRRP